MGSLVLHRFRYPHPVTGEWTDANYSATETEIRAYTAGRYQLVGPTELVEVGDEAPASDRPSMSPAWVFAIAVRNWRVALPASVAGHGPLLFLVPEEPAHFRVVGQHGLVRLIEETMALPGSAEKARRLAALMASKAEVMVVDDEGTVALPAMAREHGLRKWIVMTIAGQRVELWAYDVYRRRHRTSAL